MSGRMRTSSFASELSMTCGGQCKVTLMRSRPRWPNRRYFFVWAFGPRSGVRTVLRRVGRGQPNRVGNAPRQFRQSPARAKEAGGSIVGNPQTTWPSSYFETSPYGILYCTRHGSLGISIASGSEQLAEILTPQGCKIAWDGQPIPVNKQAIPNMVLCCLDSRRFTACFSKEKTSLPARAVLVLTSSRPATCDVRPPLAAAAAACPRFSPAAEEIGCKRAPCLAHPAPVASHASLLLPSAHHQPRSPFFALSPTGARRLGVCRLGSHRSAPLSISFHAHSPRRTRHTRWQTHPPDA
ncbi:hypothetical protein N658DRAFT_58461 [Parathielavia hyrcaniae]|uniref:Uncharacterized protein n=1 Tax=Parathielavia hyrcaniae TaxID=113614 RepID=A0AAN6Q5J1_9PEZI|nr:hypothetical protein N658DRAFT_58461 [Parathielavia hyrcaniae]